MIEKGDIVELKVGDFVELSYYESYWANGWIGVVTLHNESHIEIQWLFGKNSPITGPSKYLKMHTPSKYLKLLTR